MKLQNISSYFTKLKLKKVLAKKIASYSLLSRLFKLCDLEFSKIFG